jgi:hypothetical protein
MSLGRLDTGSEKLSSRSVPINQIPIFFICDLIVICGLYIVI